MFDFSCIQIGMGHDLKELRLPKKRKEHIRITTNKLNYLQTIKVRYYIKSDMRLIPAGIVKKTLWRR